MKGARTPYSECIPWGMWNDQRNLLGTLEWRTVGLSEISGRRAFSLPNRSSVREQEGECKRCRSNTTQGGANLKSLRVSFKRVPKATSMLRISSFSELISIDCGSMVFAQRRATRRVSSLPGNVRSFAESSTTSKAVSTHGGQRWNGLSIRG